MLGPLDKLVLQALLLPATPPPPGAATHNTPPSQDPARFLAEALDPPAVRTFTYVCTVHSVHVGLLLLPR